jgi:glycosyltransferase involved in cell wall biosynthesis
MKESLTVLMTVYNAELYLRQSIESILNQTFCDFEFLIVDDGSNDQSVDIIESYKDSRIKLIRQANTGQTKALNRGIELAEGDIIARQDSDDISMPDRLMFQKNYIMKNQDVMLVGSYVSFIDQYGEEKGVWKPPCKHEKIVKDLQEYNTFCHGSVMLRKKQLNVIGKYRNAFKYSQDYDCWIRLSEKYRVANIDKILYKFRMLPKSISQKRFSDQIDYHLLAIEARKKRKLNGNDYIEKLQEMNTKTFFTNILQIKKNELKKRKAAIALKRCGYEINKKNYRFALRMWVFSMLKEPKIWKIRFYLSRMTLSFREQ